VSTDGNRIYVSQWHDGFLMLDSSKLIRTLRGQDSCDPNQVTTPDGGADHCITFERQLRRLGCCASKRGVEPLAHAGAGSAVPLRGLGVPRGRPWPRTRVAG
jgi:hypothetical protein